MTVEQNVQFGVMAMAASERQSISNHYLKMVGLDDYREHFPSSLSGGMKQRVELARALVARPRILLMDEPFSALDYLTRLRMRADLLRICRNERITVLFVTHDVDEALQLGDRVLVMGNSPSTIVDELCLCDSVREPSHSEYQSLRARVIRNEWMSL